VSSQVDFFSSITYKAFFDCHCRWAEEICGKGYPMELRQMHHFVDYNYANQGQDPGFRDIFTVRVPGRLEVGTSNLLTKTSKITIYSRRR
jgi:hypothetical protein